MRTTVAYAMTRTDLTPGSRERLQNTAEEHEANRLRVAVSGEKRSDGNRISKVVETSNHKIWSRT
jgi:hypothetical protein